MDEEKDVKKEQVQASDEKEEKPAEKEKTFTQTDVNNIVAKEVAKALKKAGRQPPAKSGEGEQAASEQSFGPDPALAEAQQALMAANAKLAAIHAGMQSAMVDDAVLLAIHEAQKEGKEVDEDSISEALNAVLKRHPEWKQEDKKLGGIRVGAGSAGQAKSDEDALSSIFGNKKT